MATFRQIFTGLSIIAKYEADYLDTHIFTTTHNQLWAGMPGGPATSIITSEDKELMRQNGWFIENPEGSKDERIWSHFT
jgi:hypothetical protein